MRHTMGSIKLSPIRLDEMSLPQRISGKANIEEVDEIKEKYTEDAPQ